jgi:hypothetical protein
MEAFGSIVGQVEEVSVANKRGESSKTLVRGRYGWVINPDTIKAQMEGGTLYGLTAALEGEITIQNGRVMQHHFNEYPIIRWNDDRLDTRRRHPLQRTDRVCRTSKIRGNRGCGFNKGCVTRKESVVKHQACLH